MDEERRSWRRGLWRLVKALGWLVALVLIVQQAWWAPFRAEVARTRVIDRFQQDRKSRVIAMIHRQDTQSLFGVPVSPSITSFTRRAGSCSPPSRSPRRWWSARAR